MNFLSCRITNLMLEIYFSELLFPDNEVFEVENKLFGHIPEPIDVVENISYYDLHKEIG